MSTLKELNRIALTLLSFLTVLNAYGQEAQTASDVLQGHLQSTGGVEAWQEVSSMQMITEERIVISGTERGKSEKTRYVQMEGLERIEQRLAGTLNSVILATTTNDRFVYKYTDGKISGSLETAPEPVFIKVELSMIDELEKWNMKKAEYEGKPVYELVHADSKKRMVYDLATFEKVAEISVTGYGIAKKTFKNYTKVNGLSLAQEIKEDIPDANYTVLTEVKSVVLNPKLEKSLFIKDDSWRKIKVGAAIPEFELEVFGTGEPLNNLDLKGKVVLIDFWATWCKPCIKEIPNIRAAYEKYHNAGFEVLGVSFDEREASLERFLSKRNLPWQNANVAEGLNSTMAGKFEVAALPKTILVKDGKIIAMDKDTKGEELMNRLSELFANH